MSVSITSRLPTIDAVLELSPEELAWYLFDDIKENANLLNKHNCLLYTTGSPILPYYKNEGRPDSRVEQAFREAWAYLEREGILIAAEHQNAYFISRRGRAIASRGDYEQLLRSSALRREAIHPALTPEVWPSFVRGEYETAVFKAFRFVEVKVREAGDFPDDVYGTTLMGKAFNAERGPLRDDGATDGEREATLRLFLGAIGLFKNPTSHRYVKHFNDPNAAAELIGFASALVRIVERATEPRK